MKKTALPLLVLATLVCVAGCAKINDAGRRLLASSAPALAVVNGTLLSGKVSVFTDRTGTVTLESERLSCSGNQRYTATRTGVFNLNCSDGSDLQLSFVALAETSGHARGRTAAGTASLTYGLEPAVAVAYLELPAGMRLVSRETGMRLEPIAPPAAESTRPTGAAPATAAAQTPDPATRTNANPVPTPSVVGTPIPRP